MPGYDYGQRGVAGDVQIGRRGPRYKNSSGVVQFRNAGDTAFARVQGADSVTDDDLVTRRQLLAAGGALAGLPGTIYASLQFYMDPSDRNSYPASGSIVTDIMGNATSGTLTGGSFSEGAFEFDGSTTAQAVSFTKGSVLDNVFSGGGTVIAFLRPVTDGQSDLGVVADTSNDTDVGWTMHTSGDAAGHIGVRFQRNFSASAGGTWTSNTQVNPFSGQNDRVLHRGVWASWAVAYDDALTTNDPTFYINGTSVALTEDQVPVGSANSDAGTPLRIGSTVNVSNPKTFDGQLGPILVFDRVLTADEIAAVHNMFAQRFALGWRGMDGQLFGSNTAGMSGQDVYIRAGDSQSSTNSEAEGGDLYLLAGNHLGGGNAASGRILIRSGSGGGNVGDAGAMLIESGQNGLGAWVTIRVGRQNTGNTPGDMTVTGGDNDGSGFSGDLFMRAGSAVGSARTGGTLTVRAGEATDNPNRTALNGPGGAATFRAGDGNQNAGGLGQGGNCIVRAGNSGVSGGQGGDLSLLAGNSAVGNSRGGHVVIASGSAAGAFGGGNMTISAGTVGGTGSGAGGTLALSAGSTANGIGGDASMTAGNTAASVNGNRAGNATVQAGNATATSSNTTAGGGTASLLAGSSAKTATTSPGGDAIVTAGAGTANSANSRAGKVQITGGAVTGTTAGAVAGNVEITGGGSPNAAGTAGSVIIKGGTSNGGTHGKVALQTASETTPVQIRTQTGFAGTDEEHLTVGVNTTLTPGSNVDLLTLGTLATAGHNYKFQVEVTGVDSASADDQNQQAWIVTYYRNSTGIAAYTADLNPGKHIASIGGFSIDIDYSLVIVGNDIRLRATNSSSTVTYVGLFAVKCVRQEGGISS